MEDFYVCLSLSYLVLIFGQKNKRTKERDTLFFCPPIDQYQSCVMSDDPIILLRIALFERVLFHDKLHSCPVVLFPMMHEFHSQTFRFLADKRNILHIESAHEDFRARMHTGGIPGKVSQKNIPVDVRDNYIKRRASFQQTGVTQFHGDVVYLVKCDVVS